ncbi:hypothetical protein HPB50_017394 [Hyalomma asiaticum]|uniref:Uncharacterized protein n=1 Tax=Hyalomma asiaticum TaxID=266040 RepID=A0ACB7SUV8_HYAAI|nr:hypothetical protein HPB50_017394 [Hyalomma asiaticum]
MNPKDHRSLAKRHLPQSACEAIAEKFEHNFRPTDPQNYDEFVRELKCIMKQHAIRVNSRGGKKRKGWWDKEVQDVLDARRMANRLHRVAVKSLSSGEECKRAWEKYLSLKREMQALVQSKIAEHNSRQLKSITEAGQNGAKKFWNYVSTLDRKAPTPEIRHESSGQPITDLAAHLTVHLQNLFNSSRVPRLQQI